MCGTCYLFICSYFIRFTRFTPVDSMFWTQGCCALLLAGLSGGCKSLVRTWLSISFKAMKSRHVENSAYQARLQNEFKMARKRDLTLKWFRNDLDNLEVPLLHRQDFCTRSARRAAALMWVPSWRAMLHQGQLGCSLGMVNVLWLSTLTEHGNETTFLHLWGSNPGFLAKVG